ncbi:hypothetical protein SCOR_05355 [Sulfidibacter corallicola]
MEEKANHDQQPMNTQAPVQERTTKTQPQKPAAGGCPGNEPKPGDFSKTLT